MHTIVVALLGVLCGFAQDAAPAVSMKAKLDQYKMGHSHLGEPFDLGPRQKPWEMQGIGKVHFPISTKNPEVQKWFDQGVTLLHSFWDYEAERAFRWCLKLEPENAMVYWGLAKATSDKRSQEFTREAVKRKHTVTGRERLYIEALAALVSHDALRDRGDDYQRREREYRKVLETLTVKYPDDMEAKALLALSTMGDSRYGTELMVREILAKQPDHPGAHHYRIHNWNYHEPEQALASCRRYGEIAPNAGHALHMPGHVYSTAGMWHEAAISMDSATRAEKRVMRERLTFPFNHWNYGHNRHYLSYIQEQLGKPEAAMFGARQLIDAPLDPDHNSDIPYSSHSQGITAMLRACVKYERWSELLDSRTIPWREILSDKLNKKYAETRAHLGLGNNDKAEAAFATHQDLKKEIEKNKALENVFNIQTLELKGRIALKRGETLAGLSLLAQAAEKQFETQKGDNDPPRYPEVLFNALGRAYLEAKSPELAAKAFGKGLELTRNDIFALSGLVESHHALGNKKEAESYLARLLFTASSADSGIKLLERALATGIKVQPKDQSPGKQRIYDSSALDSYGPNVWEPFPAPSLDAVDSENKPVTLSEFAGKNVILVFYLGRECLHCMKQLKDIQAKKSEWERLDTVVLAVSGNKPEDNARNLKSINLPNVRILSDSDFVNARRYKSYDDFEEMELHSTILIDRKGRVHWARTGGEPFSKMDFLVKQLERMNKSVETGSASSNGVF
ncbi:MAG: redoxin domain-containing protein [Acidobacteria bacterium]|nr:redoxin domain-containing protein [Acidobacteriota bacterium]